MARGTIKLAHRVEYLSVLDSDGRVDESHAPEIDDDLLRRMHRTMLRARRFDARMLKLQREGEIGTFGPVKGQEAAQVASAATLRDEDWVVPSYRETAVALWRGTPMEGILLYNAGFNEGGRVPDGQRDLPIAIPVGSQMLHAVGIAYAARRRGEDVVAMTYFGDGATSEGDFHEAMNFAAVYGTPVVFLCTNNQWAISVPRDQQTRSRTLAQKALAYGMPGMQVDGNDPLAVFAAAEEAVRRAREERQPSMIECVTYRLGVHTTADDPSKYRDEEEVEEWREREPLKRFGEYLRGRGLLDDEALETMEAEIEDEIEQAWRDAKERMKTLAENPAAMFDHLYAERPAYLEAQRARFAEEAAGPDGADG